MLGTLNLELNTRLVGVRTRAIIRNGANGKVNQENFEGNIGQTKNLCGHEKDS